MRLASLALVLMTAAANAQDAPRTLSTYLAEPEWAARFDRLFADMSKPDWLARATEGEQVDVTLDGKPFSVLFACKQHDCGAHQMAVLFDNDTMYALQLETDYNSPHEALTWLNIGGGPESIDGKTILYAAMTGSLFNHPDMFDFPAE
ncbi:hypothetical protein BVG79_00988 [Ketogulonicigenium robustum]|uniref:C-lysozyme inhibitor n=1 Tax=Ketogulonicigenium robustum TaxID=92947 RepID=A0A1W6NYK0_9RHOB|nr:Ivy family c-type lysozyme inhibitor [Ketogulonicigenium robustum]ARO14336.1 hypothetical protein BVG79_00988 [Ketogulonicigenium robustum]